MKPPISGAGKFHRRNLWQFGKFLTVGAANTIIGYSIFALLIMVDLSPSTALVLTYCFAAPVNYLTTGKIVFEITNLRSFLLFLVSYIAIYFLNLGALALLMQSGMGPLLGQGIVVPFIAILSFLIFKILVFRNS